MALDLNSVGNKITQDQKTISGYKMCMIRVYDGKDGKSTVVHVKNEGNDFVMTLDEEVDFETHFKCKRGTKAFGQAVMERLKIVDGKLDVDWTGIKRITLELKEKKRKEAELAKKLEEEKKRKEQEAAEAAEKERRAKAEAEQKRVDEEKRKAAIEKARIEREEAAEKLRIEREEQKRIDEEKRRQAEIEAEAERKKKEFMSKIAGAAGGALTPDMLRKLKGGHGGEEEAAPGGESNENAAKYEKLWNDERKAYYWIDESSGDVHWRDPSIQSVWVKEFSDAKNAFVYRNKVDGKVIDEPPFNAKYETMWIEDFGRWRYVHRETGDVLENEPFY